MTSTMYIPLVNISDAANSEHSTFGRSMAKRTCFVMVSTISSLWTDLPAERAECIECMLCAVDITQYTTPYYAPLTMCN